MSRKSETNFVKRIKDLKKLNKNYYFQPIETSTSRGVCDLFTIIKGRSFWLEIKVNHGKKVSKNIGLSKYQQAWQIILIKHGGHCFNLVRVPMQRVVKTYRIEPSGVRELATHSDTEDGICQALEHMAEQIK